MGVLVLPQFATKTDVQLFHEINRISEVVARHQPPHRILLGDKEIRDKSQQTMLLIPSHRGSQEMGQARLRLLEQRPMRVCVRVRQSEIAVVRQDCIESNLHYLKVIFAYGTRWTGGQLA